MKYSIQFNYYVFFSLTIMKNVCVDKTIVHIRADKAHVRAQFT